MGKSVEASRPPSNVWQGLERGGWPGAQDWNPALPILGHWSLALAAREHSRERERRGQRPGGGEVCALLGKLWVKQGCEGVVVAAMTPRARPAKA